MLETKFNANEFMVSGFFAIIIGLFTIIFKERFFLPLLAYVGILLVFKGIIEQIKNMTRRKIKKRSFIFIFIGLIIYYIGYFYKPIGITIALSIYFFIFGVIQFINFCLYVKNHLRGSTIYFIHSFIYFSFVLLLMIRHVEHLKYVCVIIGVIIIVYGIKNIIFSLSQLFPKKSRQYLIKAQRFPVPDFITIFYPTELTNQIYKLIKHNETDNYNIDNKKTDLQIYLHLTVNGFLQSFGHMDIGFEGKIISFANYDRHSRKFLDLIGDGVMVVANQEKYINYNINIRNRYIIEFGLVLTDEQKEKIRSKIKYLYNNNNIKYLSDKEKSLKGEILNREFHDMSSEIYMYADGDFRKFTSGVNRIFSITHNNCTFFMQQILKEIGHRIYSINGLWTPGAFYEYFNCLYKLNYTDVISRRIYVKGSEFKCQNYQK